jgi:hypothetical protein
MALCIITYYIQLYIYIISHCMSHTVSCLIVVSNTRVPRPARVYSSVGYRYTSRLVAFVYLSIKCIIPNNATMSTYPIIIHVID